MVTLTRCITIVELLLDGRFTGNPDGVTNEAVSIKKISSRKMISVIDDMLNAACTLCLEFRFIVFDYWGSCKRSRKFMDVYSIRYTNFCTRVTR